MARNEGAAVTYSTNTLLAILQQAEYDLEIWQHWQKKIRDEKNIIRLNQITQSTETLKIRLIRIISQTVETVVSPSQAITFAVKLLLPFENLATRLLIMLASFKLRRYQKKGLTVIGVAGSYGKTSVKHLIQHTLSQQAFSLCTPASFNTQLGIALTILRQLHSQHQYFTVELGEYQLGDIQNLLDLIRPQYGVLTPIGFSHGDRFENKENMISTFCELLESKWSPQTVSVDDQNKGIIKNKEKVKWYGKREDSILSLSQTKVSLNGSTARLTYKDTVFPVNTRLWREHQLRNALPGLLLADLFGFNFKSTLTNLKYAPDIPRRLEITRNLNGSVLIDNSYNTNPGSWQEMVTLLKKLRLSNLAVITAGFVELQPDTVDDAHNKLAEDLTQLASIIVILKTHDNDNLLKSLEQNKKNIIVADTFDEALQKLQTVRYPIEYLWLEGGNRELYS